jgi:hypothetical protein
MIVLGQQVSEEPGCYSTYRDTFKIGGLDSVVTGIATSFGANLRVLQLAQKAGLNMLIPHEHSGMAEILCELSPRGVDPRR